MHILVLAGGDSGEREVSLRSGAAVAAALQSTGHEVELFDPAKQAISSTLAAKYDLAFPILHGAGGEDGTLQMQLETIGLPYVGSAAKACQLTFDKPTYKRTLAQADITLPEGTLVRNQDAPAHPLFQAPFVLKPYDGGSSVDTFIVRDVATAPWDDIRRALEKYDEMLLEELIEGVEVTVGVLGEQALPVIEIVPPEHGEFDYENKYNGATQELCPPEHVDMAVQQAAQELGVKIHQLCDCRDFSRTDMIVTPDNRLVVLETNPLPGMTDQSLLPKAAGVAGITMLELCNQLVTMAADRRTGAA
jgi:D-alanine-D-alanine ligase